MARVVWKGAIVFGLVHIPIELYPGSKDNDLDFDWIDKRDNAPVGYQRINKKTGKPIEMSDIVKGYEWEKGNYVILKDEDFKAANPKATQTVEILAFVDREAIPPLFFERPYRLVPGKRGEKGYALLRETLNRANKVGVAQVVIRNRQHLAVLMPMGDMLELITMRYADEVLGADEFDLPSLKEAKVSDKEVQLAERLVEDMSEDWNPKQYHDSYRDDLMKRIEALATQGRTHLVKTPAGEQEKGGAQIIDLMAALKRSLETKGPKSSGRAAAKGEEEPARLFKRAATAKTRSTRSVKSSARKRA
jgi:DNA end-binding protein Ku